MKIRLNPNRHRGGFFGIGESRSETLSTVTEQQATASEGSLAVGAAGKYQEQGATDFSGGSNVSRLGSTEFSAGGNVTITTADTDVLKTALDSYAKLSAGFGSSLDSFVSKASEEQDKKIATLLTAVEKGKESEDTGAQNRKLFLWIVLAVLGVIAFLNFRKS
jgi:hypothetical protein